MLANKNSVIAAIGVIVIIAVAAIVSSKPENKEPGKTFRKTGEIALSELANLSGCDLLVVSSGSAANYDFLAKCLTDKGVKMYGAYWCGHCKNQKEMFGNSFQYIDYIECADGQSGQAQVCKDNGITSYPTWEFPGKAQ